MTREEAIKVVKERLDYYESEKRLKAACEVLIPELKESEDERIRKGLIEALKTSKTVGELKFILPEPTREECIAYLEKLKENTWSEEDDAKVKAMCEEGNLKPSERAWLKDLSNRVWKEQKPAEHSAKGRRGRIGTTPEHIRKKAENFLSKMEPPYDADDICSAYETGAMEKANPSWSEEDETMLENIRYALRYAYSNSVIDEQVTKYTMDWLKSLRPSWRPSEEQMGAVKHAYNSFPNDCSTKSNLKLLYHDLEKLM